MNKTLYRCFCLTASALLLLPGCGKSENAQLNDSAARSQSAAAIKAINSLRTGGNGQGAAFAMIALGQNAQGLLQKQSESRSAPMAIDLDALREMSDEKGCSCTDNSCTFTDCGNSLGFKLNGEIKWSKTSMKCDYKVTGEVGGMEYKFSIDGDLKYSEKSIDGDLKTEGSVKGNVHGHKVDVSWNTSLVFNNIELSSGKPVKGSMSIKSEIKSQDGEELRGSGEVSFDK